jgi:DNA-binding NarL/FixJ family response regulator
MATVLIVDDYAAIRTAIRARFASCSGLEVCGEAVDGIDAIDKARQLKPDLILLDMAMPRMNGIEAASVLKGLLPDVRIIAFTMYAEALRDSLAADVGIDAVLAKPDGIGRLVECVRGVLQPHASRSPLLERRPQPSARVTRS